MNSSISWALDNGFQNGVSFNIFSAKSFYIGIAPREHKLKYTHNSSYLPGSIIETLPLNQGILSFEFCHDWGWTTVTSSGEKKRREKKKVRVGGNKNVRERERKYQAYIPEVARMLAATALGTSFLGLMQWSAYSCYVLILLMSFWI